MRAMTLEAIGKLADNPRPLRPVDVPRPVPDGDQVLIEVRACGVCHTELDEIEGRTPPPRLPVIPGHEVVGKVLECGPDVRRYEPGDRVGVGWIWRSSGADDENLSEDFVATGRDVDGGYAEMMVVGERYAYPIPDCFGDAEAAPLLCAGSVGYRSLRLANLENGAPLGLTGFGGSGHIVLQLAQFLYPDSEIFVFARSDAEQAFARELGAHWAGHTDADPPRAPAAVIDTTPAWHPVLRALSVLRPGGRLVINAIRKENADRRELADIDYGTQLWHEKEIKSVANVSARDIAEFLPLAARAGLRPDVRRLPLEAANEALAALKRGHLRGAYVLEI